MKSKKLSQIVLGLILGLSLVPNSSTAGTITIVGNGAGGGPIFVTSAGTSIDIGTRVRIGIFSDLTALNNAISNANSAGFAATLSALNSNFVDLGTGATNFGASSQTANGGASFIPSTTTFGFNNITSLTVNGVTSNWNTFNGQITNVNYSLSVGVSKNLYTWVAFNDQIGIVRNADGTGTAAWITPASDLNGVTMNLSGLQASGVVQSSEVLLGSITEYGSGNDLIRLQVIPEPSSASLLLLGIAILVQRKRRS